MELSKALLVRPDIAFRPWEAGSNNLRARLLFALRHPVFRLLGLRPVLAQHTHAEHEALAELARGRASLVEIGVAEGASALALRGAMSPSGVLYCIDPFHLSRVPWLNTQKRVARRTVDSCRNGAVVWVPRFSHQAAAGWNRPIDFLFVDGDHSESAVLRDWRDWHPHVVPGGIVAFHDARVFPGGWVTPSDGPVELIERLFRRSHAPGWRVVREVDSLVAVTRDT